MNLPRREDIDNQTNQFNQSIHQTHTKSQSSKSASIKQSLPIFIIVLGILLIQIVYLNIKIYSQEHRFLAIQAKIQLTAKNIADQRQYIDNVFLENGLKQLPKVLQALDYMKSQMNDMTKTQKPPQKKVLNPGAELNKQQFKKQINEIIELLEQHELMIRFLEEFLKKEHYDEKMAKLNSFSDSQILQWEKPKNAYLQAQANIKLEHLDMSRKKEVDELVNKEYDWMKKYYKYEEYEEELAMCVVIPTYNNAKQFRYEYNLQSIFNQKYSNYRLVIIDDASTDGTPDLIQRYLKRNNIPSQQVILIRNAIKDLAVANIHKAITQHCHSDDIVYLVDGDDELLGNHIFKTFNSIYLSTQSQVVYSDHLQVYWHKATVIKGWSMPYTETEKKTSAYRDVPQKIAHLRSFKASLYLKIKESDLKDENGTWFKNNYDEAICLPLLEMSCTRNQYIQEYMYLYNFGIGSNDWLINPSSQHAIAKYIRTLPKYGCLPENE